MSGAIRLLARSDLAELVNLCREHADYERAAWNERENRKRDLEALFFGSSDTRCWVIEGRDELAGFATATLERSTWDAGRFLHLDCIYLRSAYRSRGLGRRLMTYVAAAAVELGAINLQWQTPVWNEGAIRFYGRLGASAAQRLRFTLSPALCTELAESRAAEEGGE